MNDLGTRKGLIYARVSSERQKKEGHGLESQEQRCRAYARQTGIEVERVFSDSYTGGGDFMLRPAMREMLEYVDAHSAQRYVVIFDDLKRFARDVVFHMKLRSALKARDVIPQCLNYNFDDSEEGQFVETIFAAQSELERKQNRRQVIQKQKARLELGYWSFTAPPGYRFKQDAVHGKLLVRDEPEATVIQNALEKFSSGELPDQMSVLRYLVSSNYKGGKVYPSSVSRLLSHVQYTGHIEYPSWNVSLRPGHHEPIISLETYRRVQERLMGVKRMKTRKDIRDDFPLRGFVLCSECELLMTASWSTGKTAKHPYYRCKSVKACSKAGKSIRKEVIEERFVELLRSLEPSREVLELTKAIARRLWEEKEKTRRGGLVLLRSRLAAIEGEIEALVGRAAKSTSEEVIKAYEDKIAALGLERRKLQEGLAADKDGRDFGTALERVLAFVEKPVNIWQRGGLNDKRLVLKLVFAENLTYHSELGFGTPELSPILKLFTEIATYDSQDVEVGRFELPSEP